MTHVMFMRPRRRYESYQDFYAIAQCAGFPLLYLDEIDWARPGIVIGTPWTPDWSTIPHERQVRLVHWNLERCRADAAPDDMATGIPHPEPDEVWMSDRALASQFNARYVFLGGVENFVELAVREPRYDLITLMYWSHRRAPLREQLRPFKVADWDKGCWGEERTEKLAESTILFSAHQDDEPWSEPIKFALAGMHAIPLLSELCLDAGYWIPGKHYFTAPFERLATYAAMLIRPEHETTRRAMAANAWRLVCKERPFRKTVLEAVWEQVAT